MVAQTHTQQLRARRDRWVNWLVVAVFLVALVIGWGVKSAAESRAVRCEAGNMVLSCPAGWVRAKVEPPVILRVEERVAPFRSAISLEERPLPKDMPKPLLAVQQALTLERAGWVAYRILSVEEAMPVGKRTAMRVTFAYVETNPNPFLETLPVVMHGEDYILPAGEDKVQVATFVAAQENYPLVAARFAAFLRSLPG
jgi:hypothetical protein